MASGTAWAPGKGVIGRCVAEGRVVAEDLAAADAALGDVDAAGWQRLPADVRQGLTHEEHRRLRGRYGVVVAVPLVDDSGPVSAVTGCLALDGPAGALAQLGGPAVLGVLEATGRAVARLEAPATAAARAAAAPPPAPPEPPAPPASARGAAPRDGRAVLHAQLLRLGVAPARAAALVDGRTPGGGRCAQASEASTS
ncbi:hypothetical protein [Kineococcus gypseus]|uniref:hypothetical protein n=1 Tax=Kineococcus gypseus TaxID=1637102 RepID=UPI003D7D3013